MLMIFRAESSIILPSDTFGFCQCVSITQQLILIRIYENVSFARSGISFFMQARQDISIQDRCLLLRKSEKKSERKEEKQATVMRSTKQQKKPENYPVTRVDALNQGILDWERL